MSLDDLAECRSQIERQLLTLESKTYAEIHDVKTEIALLKAAISALNESVKGLVTISRFRPVEVFTWGMASGVGLYVLGQVLVGGKV